MFQKALRQTTWQIGRNTVGIWMIAPLQYLLITVKVVTLEKVSFSNTENTKVICEQIDSQWEALSPD